MKLIDIPPGDNTYYLMASRYMAVAVSGTATKLAEETANHLERPDWLDDPDHWIWELATFYTGDD